MSYLVELSAAAKRQLDKLPTPDRILVARKLQSLAADPRQPGAKRLQGTANGWRARAGIYRILYVIMEERLLVTVLRVAQRKEAYRNLPEGM